MATHFCSKHPLIAEFKCEVQDFDLEPVASRRRAEGSKSGGGFKKAKTANKGLRYLRF